MNALKTSFIIILLSLILSACNDVDTQKTSDGRNDKALLSPEKVETVGNMPGSFGQVVSSNDGAYYYTDPYKGIMKVTEEGIITVLASDKTERIHVSDDWIYYHSMNDSPTMEENSGTFYKLSTDGKEKTVFIEFEPPDDLIFLKLINDRIYFRYEEGISRISIVNKTIEQVVKGDSPAILGAKEEWIYLKSGNVFYKTHLDGSNKTLIYECGETAYRGSFDGEWLYFVTYENDPGADKLYKMRLDGSDLTAYTQLPYPDRPEWGGWSDMHISPYDGWIYYKSGSTTDGEYLRRLSADFTNGEDFIEGKKLDFGIVDNWIFYRDTNIFEHTVYMMKLDKSKKIKLYSVDLQL